MATAKKGEILRLRGQMHSSEIMVNDERQQTAEVGAKPAAPMKITTRRRKAVRQTDDLESILYTEGETFFVPFRFISIYLYNLLFVSYH